MANQVRPRYLPLLSSLIVGLALIWAALALLTVVGRPPVARAQNSVRYVVTSGTDGGNLCTDPDTPCATIQHAVDVSDPGDEIRVAGGTYTDVHTRPAPTDYNGPSAITQVVYISQSLSIRGGYSTAFADPPDPEAYPTTLDAQGRGRVLFIVGDISPTLEGLWITGGDAARLRGARFYGYDAGGGVYVVTATTAISHNWVLSNTADFGGGVYLYHSTATLSSDTITSNTAAYEGGGLALDSSHATINGSTVSANTAGYCGGGLALEESVITLNDSLVSDNGSGHEGGGGLYLFGSDAILISNTIVSNTTSFIGGGLVAYWGSTATLTGNTIISNTSGTLGGGLGVRYGHLALSRNTIIANVADYGGGLVVLDSSTAMLTNNAIVANRARIASSGLGILGSSVQGLHTTIAHNMGGDGSGIYMSYNSTATLTNTILVSQTLGITTTDGSTATLDGVLWFGNGANTAGEGTINVTHAYTGDPAFAADGYHLTTGSAAINRGVRAGVMTDIDGQIRDAAPDLGADEYPLTEIIYLPIIMRDR